MSELRGLGLAIGAFGAAVVGACVLETGGLSPAGVGGAGGSSLTLIGPTSSSLSSGGNPNVGGGGAGPTSSTAVGGGGTGPGGGGAGGMPDVGRIVAGNFHTCFISPTNDQVSCWGEGDNGRLGLGDDMDRLTPALVQTNGQPLTASIDAALGVTSSCTLDGSLDLRCFGSNGNGHFGTGSLGPSNVPTLGFGTVPDDLVAVGVGEQHACVLTLPGTVFCAGRDQEGQLGNGTATPSSSTPEMVAGGLLFTQVSVGFNHTCGVTTGTNEVRCWGNDVHGQLGSGIAGTSADTPQAPVALGQGAKTVVAGFSGSCALLMDDTVSCWGFNGNGQLGTGNRDTPIPVTPLGLTAVESFDLGTRLGCAVLTGGAVRCWGDRAAVPLGDGVSGVDPSVPISVTPSAPAQSIAVGEEHACALLDSGAVECWGNNGSGQLGDNSTDTRTTPVAVQF
ncbi:MAG: hypothetical protein AAGA56_06590 [Myxococcota bacterium]